MNKAGIWLGLVFVAEAFRAQPALGAAPEYVKRTRNVVSVATDGSGDFSDPVAALASITDATASNPYLVKVTPGLYNISTRLTMRPYVDLEGSGEAVTQIVANVPIIFPFALAGSSEIRNITLAATVAYDQGYESVMVDYSGPGSDPLRMSHVTLVNNATASYRTALRLSSSTYVYLNNVTVKMGGYPGGGEAVAIHVMLGSAWMRDCEISVESASAKGMEIDSNGSELNLDSSRVAVHGLNALGVYATNGVVRARNTVVTAVSEWGSSFAVLGSGEATFDHCELIASIPGGGSPYAVYTQSTAVLSLAYTKVQGLVDSGLGALRCIGVYDPGYSPVVCRASP